MSKLLRVRSLVTPFFFWLAFIIVNPLPALNNDAIPAVDLHVHLSDSLSITRAAELSSDRGVLFGIVEHPGLCEYCPIQNDRQLKEYISTLRPYPVYIGLQPVIPGWRDLFSPILLEKLDYIIMDALEIPQEDGTILRIWQDDTQVEDLTAFMQMYVDYHIQILTEEDIDVLANATFLPKCIEDRYDEVWTENRVNKIINAAIENGVAFEINSYYEIPGQEFIRRAKLSGAKFSFGTNSRNDFAGTLDYALSMVKVCDLQPSDIFIPEREIRPSGNRATPLPEAR